MLTSLRATPGTPVMDPFYYVYVIQSQSHPDKYYIGFTEDLQDRLRHHNHGAVPSTKPHRPWKYRTCLAFTERQRALDFELNPDID